MAATSRSAWIEAWEASPEQSAAARRSAQRIVTHTRTARYYGREATARIPKPSPELERSRPLPKPRLVTRRKAQWPALAAVLAFAVLLLAVGVVSPMLLSARATQTESEVGRVETSETELAAAIAALNSQVAALSAPERVADQAGQFGLAPADQVHYLPSGSAVTKGDVTVAGR